MVPANRELEVSCHINSIEWDHPGRRYLRLALDDFEITGVAGSHQCIALPLMGLTLNEMRKMYPDKVTEKGMTALCLVIILYALDFLHRLGVVHTGMIYRLSCILYTHSYIIDLSLENIIIRFKDQKVWEEIEQQEIEHPSPRKVLADREIYRSYSPVAPLSGVPHIIDFGAARLGEMGQMHSGDIMPWQYRAPEIVLGMDWNDKVDIWSVGMMVRSFSRHLATAAPKLKRLLDLEFTRGRLAVQWKTEGSTQRRTASRGNGVATAPTSEGIPRANHEVQPVLGL